MFTGRHAVVVRNPSSGRGGAHEIEAAIEAEAADAGATRVVVRETAAIDDATRWAGSAAD